jgi:hypothetical protein
VQGSLYVTSVEIRRGYGLGEELEHSCSGEDYEFLFCMDSWNGGAADCVTGWGLDGDKPQTYFAPLISLF